MHSDQLRYNRPRNRDSPFPNTAFGTKFVDRVYKMCSDAAHQFQKPGPAICSPPRLACWMFPEHTRPIRQNAYTAAYEPKIYAHCQWSWPCYDGTHPSAYADHRSTPVVCIPRPPTRFVRSKYIFPPSLHHNSDLTRSG